MGTAESKQQQARALACQPLGTPQDKQPYAQLTTYRTKVSSGPEATNDGDKSGNRKTRKQQPTSGKESEAVNERKNQPRKKQKGTTGERIPAATQNGTAASVQKMSKVQSFSVFTESCPIFESTTHCAGSQVVTGSNMTEQIDAHIRSNPEAATTVDNDTTGVDDDLNEDNPGRIVLKTQPMVA
ncbi:hypothetical protein F5141DRAFT_1068079 [Pisolithus sp. B1]|nr:hypothetical protein F5141DRAFT_1068079 [Pisolithus sp. B1]